MRLSIAVGAFVLFGVLTQSHPCHAYKKVNAFLPHAPGHTLEGVKQIAVLDFSGERDLGRKLADLIIERLVQDDRVASYYAEAPGKIFKVIERSRLQQVLQEQNLGEAGRIDDAQAAKVGKVLGIDVIITGNITHSVAKRDEWEERSYRVNKQTVKRNVLCTTREVTVDCNLRIVDVNSGEIRVSESTRPVEKDRWCQDEGGGLLTEDALVSRALGGLAQTVVKLFKPFGNHVEIELHKVKTSDKAASKLAEDAAEAAEAGNLNRAYVVYNALYNKDHYNVQLLYNLGVLYEVTGNLPKARELYETGQMLKDEDKLREGVGRVAWAEDAWKYYTAMGVPLKAAEFDTLAGAQEAAQATMKMVIIKGGEKDRSSVYTASDMTTVLTAIPGKVQLPLLETGSGWVKVKLPGGKEGYVSSADVK